MMYRVLCPVVKASGTQTYLVEASSPEEALAYHAGGQSNFEDEEIEVGQLGEPDIEEAEGAIIDKPKTYLQGVLDQAGSSEAELASYKADEQAAMKALHFGVDDSRWEPGTTAVQALIAENAKLRAELNKT